MVNKENLRKLVTPQPMIKALMISACKDIIVAADARECIESKYKSLFDNLLKIHSICELDCETYLDNVKEIYDYLKAI